MPEAGAVNTPDKGSGSASPRVTLEGVVQRLRAEPAACHPAQPVPRAAPAASIVSICRKVTAHVLRVSPLANPQPCARGTACLQRHRWPSSRPFSSSGGRTAGSPGRLDPQFQGPTGAVAQVLVLLLSSSKATFNALPRSAFTLSATSPISSQFTDGPLVSASHLGR